jgi:hypothetical protein
LAAAIFFQLIAARDINLWRRLSTLVNFSRLLPLTDNGINFATRALRRSKYFLTSEM